jgi:cytochrome c-type biogenesis protein CcmH/NrfG
MSPKTEKLIHQYEQNEPMPDEESVARRGGRAERVESRNNRLLAAVAAGILAVVGVGQYQHDRSMPPMRTITETIQPKDYENPSLVVGRAEQEFGHDAADFNIQSEALRIANKYPQLFTGEKIQVQVR